MGSSTNSVPRRVGAYEVGRLLDGGRCGEVYKARHVQTGNPAALKILRGELAVNARAVARFEREVAVLQRLSHPNIVEILDHGRLADGRPFFIMELLQGISLRQHLAVRGRLSIEETLAIIEPLSSAVAAAHAQSIVHRDIKASNVFLSEPPLAPRGTPARRVVLLDFGVAKLLDAEGPGLTAPRHVVGTVYCMAPEQILARPVDERTDVYALGVLTYRMLTGEQPFSARTPLALQQMHLYSSPRPPSALAPLSSILDAPVLRALSKEPSARQPSVEAFFKELLEAAGRPRADEERPALAIYAEVGLDPEAIDAAGEVDFSDMERILPLTSSAFNAMGFDTALETGSSLLLSRPLPEDPAAGASLRREAIESLRALHRQLECRPDRSALVRIRLCLHVIAARMTPAATVTGGPILQLSAWLPELETPRPRVSASTVAGIEVDTCPAGEAAAVAWLELR
jgi:eukaryotic-like serine/threonine-protein kinase